MTLGCTHPPVLSLFPTPLSRLQAATSWLQHLHTLQQINGSERHRASQRSRQKSRTHGVWYHCEGTNGSVAHWQRQKPTTVLKWEFEKPTPIIEHCCGPWYQVNA